MFSVRVSSIDGAGLGLWADNNIYEGIVEPKCVHSRPRTANTSSNGYVVEYYCSDMTPSCSPCIYKGELSTYGDIAHIDESSKRTRYVHMHKKYFFMRANDLAWTPNITEEEYEKQIFKNKIEMVLSFDEKGLIDGVGVICNNFISKGEEVGMTYGYNYWTS